MAGARKARGKETTLSQELAVLLAKTVVPSLRKRVSESGEVREMLAAMLADERRSGLTADDEIAFRERFIEQIGASWVLATVFVRYLEDRGWIAQRRIAGAGAEDSEACFGQAFEQLQGDAREYLLAVFRECGRLPGAREVLGPKVLAAQKLSPDAACARALLDFWRESLRVKGSDGAERDELRWRFDTDDTRVLGDLYQDLSESVRERYALLQTPDFVERFILQYTLVPAMAQQGLDGLRVLDPTCGSGHFLLGAFEMLVGERRKRFPAESAKESARRALACVHGVDLNPYAVAITRFRLLIAYAKAAGIERLSEVDGELGLTERVIVADSLIPFGKQGSLIDVVKDNAAREAWGGATAKLDDIEATQRLFKQHFHVVVGNPPYITCKDSAQRDTIREAFPKSAYRTFALGAPFTERFFQLAEPDGYVGMINANSFMKREFGRPLIEDVLRHVDLTHVVDTSGAFIPGHGTPTVILFARNRRPELETVRAVLGRRGEPSTPERAEEGKVWTSIVELIETAGSESEFVSVANVKRETLGKHPWSLGGGGAGDLKELIEQKCEKRLGDVVDGSIGRAARTGEDDAYELTIGAATRFSFDQRWIRGFLFGEAVRDWSTQSESDCIFPYDESLRVADELQLGAIAKSLWPLRTRLARRTTFQGTMADAGLRWFEYMQYTASANASPLSITFAEVATHNHFVLDRGGKVFKQTAPIIKLKEGATEDEHLALLAWLNSSVACFYLKQVSQNKGAGGARGQNNRPRLRFEKWDEFLQFSGGKVELLPLPPDSPQAQRLATLLDGIATRRARLNEHWTTLNTASTSIVATLAANRESDTELSARAVLLQELLDWQWYAALGLLDERTASRVAELTEVIVSDERIGVAVGQRAFELRMGRDGVVTNWFAKNQYSTPVAISSNSNTVIDELRRVQLTEIDANPLVALLETPEFKRRWGVRDWDGEVRAACEGVILDAVEAELKGHASVRSMREIGATLLKSERLRAVMHVCFAGDDRLLDRVAELVARESVPYLAGLRFTAAGWEKRRLWERCWEQQRKEDAGESVGAIEVPPKYDSKDYRDARWWSLRGRLDVARERFIAYPGATTDDDTSPLYGWAGWNHRERADALASLYQQRKSESGWAGAQLVALLAGLNELVPWLVQWHNEREAGDELGVGDAYRAFVVEEARELGVTREQLREIGQGEEREKGKKAPRAKKAAKGAGAGE